MALATYTDLQASVASWLSRADLTDQIPDFIALAESAIGTDVRLRDQLTVTTLATVASQEYVALPTDWLEFKYIKHAGTALTYLPPDRIRGQNEAPGYYSSAQMMNYSIEGSRLLLSPAPAAVITLDVSYYAKLPALSATPTNYLLTKYPQIYLYKALANASRFLMDDQRAMYWDSQYEAEVQKAHGADLRALSSGSPLTVRTR
jgi:hypothetical protein